MPTPNPAQRRLADLPKFSAVYFRDYGVHTVGESDPLHLFSFPDWPQLADALEQNMPDSGTVLTTEHAAFPQPQEQIPSHSGLIQDRMHRVCELSRSRGVRILLGSPVYDDEAGQWHNSILTYKAGTLESRADKRTLSGYEQAVGVIRPGNRYRHVSNGRMVLICSELLFASRLARAANHTPDMILAPCCWAVPTPGFDQSRSVLMSKVGGPDNYFRSALERAVGATLRDIPSMRRIVVVDRNVPNSGCAGPFNAVFDRV